MTERLGVVRALKAVRSVNDSLNIQFFALTMYDGLSELLPDCADHVRWRHLKQSYTCFTEPSNGTKHFRIGPKYSIISFVLSGHIDKQDWL